MTNNMTSLNSEFLINHNPSKLYGSDDNPWPGTNAFSQFKEGRSLGFWLSEFMQGVDDLNAPIVNVKPIEDI